MGVLAEQVPNVGLGEADGYLDQAERAQECGMEADAAALRHIAFRAKQMRLADMAQACPDYAGKVRHG